MDEAVKEDLEDYISAMINLSRQQEAILKGLEHRFSTLYEQKKLAWEIVSLAKELLKDEEFREDIKREMVEKTLRLKQILLESFEPIMRDEKEFIERYAQLTEYENRYSKAKQLIFRHDYEQLRQEFARTKEDIREGNEVSRILDEELRTIQECIRR